MSPRTAQPLRLECRGGRYPAPERAHHVRENVRCELEVVSGRVMLRTDDEAHPDRWEAFECDARQLAELLRVRLDAENLAASAALARDKASVMEALRAVLIAWRAGRPWDERDDTVRSALAVHREQGGLPIGPAVRRPSLGGEGVGRG